MRCYICDAILTEILIDSNGVVQPCSKCIIKSQPEEKYLLDSDDEMEGE